MLVSSLYSPEARYKTLELLAEKGEALTDLAPSFAALEADLEGSIEGVQDRDTQPMSEEPERVVADLESVRGERA